MSRRRRAIFGCLAGAALIGAAPAADNSRQELERAGALLEQGKVVQAYKLLDLIERRDKRPSARFAIHMYRAAMLFASGERAKAYSEFDAAEMLLPGEPVVARAMFEMGAGTDAELALRGLEKLIASYPDQARELPVEPVGKLLGYLYQNGQRAKQREIAARLGSIGFGGDDIQTRDEFAMSAIDHRLEAGDVEGAIAVARTIEDVPTVIQLLTDRTSSSLWPTLEARVGDGLQQPRAAAVLTAERFAEGQGKDPRAQRSLLVAYRHAGRFDEADRTGTAFASSEADMKGLDEPGGWLINEHAALLHAMGGYEDADRRYAALRVSTVVEKPWLISMAINRMQELTRAGRAAEVQPLIAEAEALPASYMSSYARQIIRQLKVCSAMMLRRKDEAASALADVVAHRADSLRLTARALMCAGQPDAAAPIVIEMLRSKDEHRSAVIAMQPDAIGPEAPRQWVGSLEPLLKRPDVRSAFEAAGRVLPVRFWHQASEKADTGK